MPEWVTKKENVAKREVCFSLSDLPATILDTITVCEKLGYDHVWIDSFCIVQNDAEDWETQAAQMADIYQYASLTI